MWKFALELNSWILSRYCSGILEKFQASDDITKKFANISQNLLLSFCLFYNVLLTVPSFTQFELVFISFWGEGLIICLKNLGPNRVNMFLCLSVCLYQLRGMSLFYFEYVLFVNFLMLEILETPVNFISRAGN